MSKLSKKASTNNALGAVYIGTAALCFAIMWALVKEIRGALPPMQLVFLRESLIAIGCFALLIKDGKDGFRTSKFSLQSLRGIFRSGGVFFGFYAVSNMPTAEATSIIFAQPIFMIPLAALLLKEKTDIKRLIATLIGFLGVMILVKPGSALFNPIALFAVAAAVISVFPNIITKLLPEEDSHMKTLFYSQAFSALCLAIPGLMLWQDISLYTFGMILAIAAFGAIAQYLIIVGYRIGEATAITPVQYVQLPLNAVFGYMLFSEMITWHATFGAALIVGTAAYIACCKKKD